MNISSFFDLGLIITIVLFLGALSGFFSERVGIINIGINGMMVFGALFFLIFGGLLNGSQLHNLGGNAGNWSFIIAIFLTILASLGIGGLFGFATIKLKADHIISGTAINLLGTSLALFLNNSLGLKILGVEELRSSYQTFLQINNSFFYGSTLILFIFTIILFLIIFLIMKYTKFGLRFMSIGENPNAADAQGINVIKYKWIGILASSVFAGVAGCIFMLKQSGATFSGDVDSLGFLSLSILIIGSWKILSISIASLLFGLLYSLSNQKLDYANISSDLLRMIPYALTLVSLIVFSKFIIPPHSLGMHFDKASR